MRILLPIILLFTFCSRLSLTAEDDQKGEKALQSTTVQASAAQSTLRNWQQEEPSPSKRALRVFYWTPADRTPAENYQKRLTGIVTHIQGFYRREMERHGFGSITFPLENTANDGLKIHLIKGQKATKAYGPKAGDTIRRECIPAIKAAGLNPKDETFLIFCNLSDWDAKKGTFSHRSPILGIGSHRGGVACVVDSPHLHIAGLSDTETKITDKRHGVVNGGKHHSILIGSIAHELGHALSLPHNRAHSHNGQKDAFVLMGAGHQAYGRELRDLEAGPRLTFANALRLASHPLFSRSQKAVDIQPHCIYNERTITAKDKSFLFSGRISANVPVYAIIAYLDPEGKGDYDASFVTTIPDGKGRFTLDCHHLTPGKQATLRLLSCHVNGATCQRSYTYAVAKDGTPEMDTLQTRFALAPLISALNNRDHSRLQVSFDHIYTKLGPGKELNRINRLAKRLVAGVTDKQQRPLEEIPTTTKSLPLSDLTPTTEKVGWGKPAYDHLPNSHLLLAAADQIYPHGIYAHAPAHHHYLLNGQWQKFTGTCGIAEHFSGSCVFIIKADGHEVYRSPVIRSGRVETFSVPVKGTQKLELITQDAGDNAHSDWAVWLTPTLHR